MSSKSAVNQLQEYLLGKSYIKVFSLADNNSGGEEESPVCSCHFNVQCDVWHSAHAMLTATALQYCHEQHQRQRVVCVRLMTSA